MNYAWGSPDRVERLFNISNPDGNPVAELWYGAHERGPSCIVQDSNAGGDQYQDLRQLLKAQPATLMGEAAFHRYGSELPFLFKILSAEKGLSIQAHPSKEQAEAGFARENVQGVDVQAGNRNYRDDNHKPECLVAAEDFWALSGFRKPGDIEANLRRLESEKSPLLLQQLLHILVNITETEKALSEFYSILMRSEPIAQSEMLNAALAYSSSAAVNEPDAEPQWYWGAGIEQTVSGRCRLPRPIVSQRVTS